MVTDQQYKNAIERIEQLERRLNSLSKAMVELTLKSDSRILTAKPVEDSEVRKDTTRYIYKGTKYCKRNLVLAVVSDYVADNNISNSQDLISVFPDSLQGSLGVVKSIHDAEKYNNSAARYFFGDEDIIRLDDGLFVVCREWTLKNIRRFLSTAEKLGYKIEIINRE